MLCDFGLCDSPVCLFHSFIQLLKRNEAFSLDVFGAECKRDGFLSVCTACRKDLLCSDRFAIREKFFSGCSVHQSSDQTVLALQQVVIGNGIYQQEVALRLRFMRAAFGIHKGRSDGRRAWRWGWLSRLARSAVVWNISCIHIVKGIDFDLEGAFGMILSCLCDGFRKKDRLLCVLPVDTCCRYFILCNCACLRIYHADREPSAFT